MITSHQKLAEFRILNIPNIEAESSIFITLIIPLKKPRIKNNIFYDYPLSHVKNWVIQSNGEIGRASCRERV